MSVGLKLMWGDKTLEQAIEDGDVIQYDVVDILPTPFDHSKSVLDIEGETLND